MPSGGVEGASADPAPTYSIVVPIFNEETVVGELASRLVAVMDGLDAPSEAILVDDGSTDRTYELMRDVAHGDRRFRLVRLSRNFGHQIAITAGLDLAAGDAVIVIDADLQDPPEVILDLAARWREGYDVVYAVRETRTGDQRWKRAAASVFYRGLNQVSEVEIPLDVGDFRLVDRRALDVFAHMRESNRFVRGMFSWIGLRQTGVVYQRQARFAGKTKYPLRRLIRLAVSGLVGFSDVPLRLALNLGFLVSLASFVVGLFALVAKLTNIYNVPGWASILVVTAFVGGVQLVVLGVIGEYIADIHGEVKGRPLYVVNELENFPGRPEAPRRAVIAARSSKPASR